ncbi:MAG: hypothetical protein ACI9BF_000502 [Candidatus Paceibacteria bacterium]|jgi:hypothetical protein
MYMLYLVEGSNQDKLTLRGSSMSKMFLQKSMVLMIVMMILVLAYSEFESTLHQFLALLVPGLVLLPFLGYKLYIVYIDGVFEKKRYRTLF